MSASGTYGFISGTVLETITGNTGGAVGPDLGGNINLIGDSPITVTGNPGGNELTISISGGGYPWMVITSVGPNAMGVNEGYITNNVALVTMTLPATAAVGDVVRITNIGAGLFRVAQNAGQSVHFSGSTTTVGVGGSLTAIEQYDSIELICVVADTEFNVLSSIGNFTIV